MEDQFVLGIPAQSVLDTLLFLINDRPDHRPVTHCKNVAYTATGYEPCVPIVTEKYPEWKCVSYSNVANDHHECGRQNIGVPANQTIYYCSCPDAPQYGLVDFATKTYNYVFVDKGARDINRCSGCMDDHKRVVATPCPFCGEVHE